MFIAEKINEMFKSERNLYLEEERRIAVDTERVYTCHLLEMVESHFNSNVTVIRIGSIATVKMDEFDIDIYYHNNDDDVFVVDSSLYIPSSKVADRVVDRLKEEKFDQLSVQVFPCSGQGTKMYTLRFTMDPITKDLKEV